MVGTGERGPHCRAAHDASRTTIWITCALCVRIRLTRAYLHLSRLALHTQHLQADSRVSLFIAEPDGLEKNPLALRRINLQGEAVVLSPNAPSYSAIKKRYLERFPQAEMMFGFGDFALWEVRLDDAHFVLGFGQAFTSTTAAPTRWTHQKVERLSEKG